MSLDDSRSVSREEDEICHEAHEVVYRTEGSTEDKVMIISRNNKVCEINFDECDSKVNENQIIACIVQEQQECSSNKDFKGKNEIFKDNDREGAIRLTNSELITEEWIITENKSCHLEGNTLVQETERRDIIAISVSNDEDEDAETKDLRQDGVHDKERSFTDTDSETLNMHGPLQIVPNGIHDHNIINNDAHHEVINDLFLQKSENEDMFRIKENLSDASVITLVFDNKSKPALNSLEDTNPHPLYATEAMEPVSESAPSIFSNCAGCILS